MRREDGDTLTQVKKTAPSARRMVAGNKEIRGVAISEGPLAKRTYQRNRFLRDTIETGGTNLFAPQKRPGWVL
ncbi:hypothetical protein BZL42_07445 [Pseudomonas indica]|nr:hypothetical protein BZL42_07445 [Pseudomonas indica]